MCCIFGSKFLDGSFSEFDFGIIYKENLEAHLPKTKNKYFAEIIKLWFWPINFDFVFDFDFNFNLNA